MQRLRLRAPGDPAIPLQPAPGCPRTSTPRRFRHPGREIGGWLLAIAWGAALCSSSAWAIGGQLGLSFAIDAPWRLEPIAQPGGELTYGPIPIVIAFHDAIFDTHRGQIQRQLLSRIHVGTLKEIRVMERIQDGPTNPTVRIPLLQLREIERKRWISTRRAEPPYELCHPYTGRDCSALHFITDSHDWHAMFWYRPQRPVTPGRDIHLQVTVVTEHRGELREWRNYLVVHAGEAPLPRFSADWLYGDLHYHAQMTDNEGESAYSYRNVVRALGAMGLDFVFATDHASDGDQCDGGVAVARCGSPQGERCIPNPQDPQYRRQCGGRPAECKVFRGVEARDLNAVRFRAAKQILYGRGGANEAVARDVATGGIASYRTRSTLPQIFMGEEVDAWPEMSAEEQQRGVMRYGDGLTYPWADVLGCLQSRGLARCREIYSRPYESTGPGGSRIRDARVFHVLDHQGAPVEQKVVDALDESYLGYVEDSLPVGAAVGWAAGKLAAWYSDCVKGEGVHPARQHLVYLPFSGEPNGEGWVSSSTGRFGGAGRTLQEILADIEGKGVTFLAHPLINPRPGSVSPDVVPYSRTALDRAWASRAVLGLQLWNENDRVLAGPTRTHRLFIHDGKVDGVQRYHYFLPWQNDASLGKFPWRFGPRVATGTLRHRGLYHGAYTWDVYLRKGLEPNQTRRLGWVREGEPRKWFMAGGSDGHGDLNFMRHGRPSADLAQWSDHPVGDTAIGKPRNLVLVGRPRGPEAPGLPGSARHTNRQVIDALAAGRFSVTDGPALRIAIDRNRNGRIDEGDFQMGSTFHLYPGEHVPVLVEWISSPEFGRVDKVELYVGTRERTYAPAKAPGFTHGPFVGGRSAGAYADGAAEVLRIVLRGEREKLGYGGLARIYLSPAQFDLVRQDGRLFYIRAFARTIGPTELGADCRNPPLEAGCGDRMAFSNPVWGRFQATCRADRRGIDADRNRMPDTCERDVPSPCPQRQPPGPSVTRPGLVPGVVVAPQHQVAVDPDRPGPVIKPPPADSCQYVSSRPALVRPLREGVRPMREGVRPLVR